MSNDKCGGGGTVRCGSVREDAGGNKAGRGETVEVHRGRGEAVETNRGRGEAVETNRGRGGAVETNRGRGEAVETNRGRGGAVEPDRDEAESRLAVRILEACRNQLFFRQRFLEQALFRLEWKEANDIYFGSDGKYLYYNCKYIIKRYIREAEQMSVDYLHTVMHCLYQHPFFCPRDSMKKDEAYWNLAADMAVECVLEEMEEDGVSRDDLGRRSGILRQMKDETGFMSAQKIFAYLHKRSVQEHDGTIFGMDIQALGELFKRDEHALWYTGRNAVKDGREESGNTGSEGEETARITPLTAEKEEDGRKEQPETRRREEQEEAYRQEERPEACGRKEQEEAHRQEEQPEACGRKEQPKTRRREEQEEAYRQEEQPETHGRRGRWGDTGREELQRMWKNVAARIAVEVQSYTNAGRGKIAGNLLQHLKKLTRENYDYSAFLMKFAAHREERMQIDEAEFDYAFYTYGLKLFGRIPLIEPLEYKEVKLIREFIIAIDTSGSCSGEAVEGFLIKTYNILRQTQTFASNMNIHIVQCDASIQEDAKIESQKELEKYIAHMTLKGFGGTDFTPVFEYADRMLENGEIRHLDGLLYFTDGYGVFPTRPPVYKTAFVFLDKAEEVRVPSWAMKVYLDSQ